MLFRYKLETFIRKVYYLIIEIFLYPLTIYSFQLFIKVFSSVKLNSLFYSTKPLKANYLIFLSETYGQILNYDSLLLQLTHKKISTL